MKKELLEKIVKTYMFVEVKTGKGNKVTHLLKRATKEELSVATGKTIFTNTDWSLTEYIELIPGVDSIILVGKNTKFASEIEYAFREYLKV